MCLYCACSVILNRQEEREQIYVDYLCRELDLVADQLGSRRRISQLHLGGGTPTKLSSPLLSRIMERIEKRFDLDRSGELAIEIDPRTVSEDSGDKLTHLRQLGFNRVSFGVQDTNQEVQEAVRRRQSWEVTEQTYEMARALEFGGVNIDLIYGLPFQTPESFAETTEKICQLRPDRIALFSYAKVPWLKAHQKALRDETLPSTEQKFQIYVEARCRFVEAGYIAIGMDHFALPTDSMAKAYRTQQLQRNFQGYSLRLADHLIGCGVTATGFVANGYFQNVKELDEYYARIDNGELPLLRGKLLTQDDRIRKWTIHRLMADFCLDKQEFSTTFLRSFDDYYRDEHEALRQLEEEGLLVQQEGRLETTEYGALFIRNIASIFDGYLHNKPKANRFSQSI
jgi:oxygen-independent coproporphyrinogen III oxidase